MTSVSLSAFFNHLVTNFECSCLRSKSFCCKTLFSIVPLMSSSFSLSAFLFFNPITSFNFRISCSLLFSSCCSTVRVFSKASSWWIVLPPIAPLLSWNNSLKWASLLFRSRSLAINSSSIKTCLWYPSSVSLRASLLLLLTLRICAPNHIHSNGITGHCSSSKSYKIHKEKDNQTPLSFGTSKTIAVIMDVEQQRKQQQLQLGQIEQIEQIEQGEEQEQQGLQESQESKEGQQQQQQKQKQKQQQQQQQQQSLWKSWWHSNAEDRMDVAINTEYLAEPERSSSSSRIQDVNINNGNNGLWSKIASFATSRYRNAPIIVDDNTRYSQLNIEQIDFLESEAKDMISKKSKSWCWFEAIPHKTTSSNIIDSSDTPGIISVYGTGSAKCPLPLNKYPGDGNNPGYNVFINDSLILPSESPTDFFHVQPLRTKILNTIKNYYNFPNEQHLYLRQNKTALLKDKKVIIISVVGDLPEKYEQRSLESQRSAYYLSKKLSQNLTHEQPERILTLSFQCPLHSQELIPTYKECVELLNHWAHLFKSVDAVFFVGAYHSVPLTLLLAKYIVQNHEVLEFDENTTVGVLSFQSCLQGYRFWDHSSDFVNNSYGNLSSNTNINENDNNENEFNNDFTTKSQQIKEKQLFQGIDKRQQEMLSKVKNYRKIDSSESKLVQDALDWLLFNWDSFRLTFFGKLYDNFMTISEKLAIDYNHPKILRNLWCNGKYMGVDLKDPNNLNFDNGDDDTDNSNNDIHIKTPNFESKLKIPANRLFELTLWNILMLTENLGYKQFIPIINLLGPFFISRSFNEYTLPPNVKKQYQNNTKVWLQEMDNKWKLNGPQFNHEQRKNENTGSSSTSLLPEDISTVNDFLQFVQYQNEKAPDFVKIYSDIYDDDLVYKCFLHNTIFTKNPLSPKHLCLNIDLDTPTSILNTVNQYDLVWKIHDSFSKLIQLKNLPQQEVPQVLRLSISLNCFLDSIATKTGPVFQRDNIEALRRLTEIWRTYQDWSPPTRGLKHLREILSVLAMYDNPKNLINDVRRT